MCTENRNERRECGNCQQEDGRSNADRWSNFGRNDNDGSRNNNDNYERSSDND